MRNFETGDLVLIINSTYSPEIIGHVGTVEHSEGNFTGHDKFGNYVSGLFVVVDLPDCVNRHGTTLWYMKSHHLIKITPDEKVKAEPRKVIIHITD